MAFLADFIFWLYRSETFFIAFILVSFIVSFIFAIAIISGTDLEWDAAEEEEAKYETFYKIAKILLKSIIFLWLIYMLLGPFWLDVIITNRPEYDFSNPAVCYLPMVEKKTVGFMRIFVVFFIAEAAYIKGPDIQKRNFAEGCFDFLYHALLWTSFGTFLLKTYPCYVHPSFSYWLIGLTLITASYWYFYLLKIQKMIIDDDDDWEKISIKESYEERKSEEEIWRKIIRERNNHPEDGQKQ